jgi:hypothetical protein
MVTTAGYCVTPVIYITRQLMLCADDVSVLAYSIKTSSDSKKRKEDIYKAREISRVGSYEADVLVREFQVQALPRTCAVLVSLGVHDEIC